VNLMNDFTRLVEYRLADPAAEAAAAAGSGPDRGASVEPAAPDTRALGEAPEPELEPEPVVAPVVSDRSVWECDDGKGWKKYTDDIQVRLRSTYAADPTSVCSFERTVRWPAKGKFKAKTENFQYQVDLSTGPDFKQLNLKSNKTRPVRRRGSWCLTHEARGNADAPLRILSIDGGERAIQNT
jgi:hypothetical protein